MVITLSAIFWQRGVGEEDNKPLTHNLVEWSDLRSCRTRRSPEPMRDERSEYPSCSYFSNKMSEATFNLASQRYLIQYKRIEDIEDAI